MDAKKQRIIECDFIRAFSALGIIVNHFCIELGRRGAVVNEYWGASYANGDWGWLFVTLFFMLSGAMLYENHPTSRGLKHGSFYYKRWKSIFPMFYFAWLFYYIQRIVKYGRFFYNGAPIRLFWTILGLDGYLSFRLDTYYILGEWFLGPIILLYLLYPVLLKAFDFFGKIKTTVTIAVLFVLVDRLGLSIQSGTFRSITSCVFSFCLGMLLVFWKDRFARFWCLIPSLLISVVLLVVPLPVPCSQNIFVHIFGCILFISLFNIGKWVMRVPVFRAVFLCVSSLSYPIFLLQHVIIDQVTTGFSSLDYSAIVYVGMFLFTVIVIVFHAWGLSEITKGFFRSRLFGKIDRKFAN